VVANDRSVHAARAHRQRGRRYRALLATLRAYIKELFDLTSNFIVIDDIDTLTTGGIEAGFDFLYRTLSRSKRQSKLLF
jgi:hypothetical protein